jgi:hypothetical protein
MLALKKSVCSISKTVLIASQMPNYSEVGGRHSFYIDSVMDYIINHSEINQIISTIRKWNNSVVYLYGRPCKSTSDFNDFIDEIKSRAGKNSLLLDDIGKGEVSLGSVAMEGLPLKIVYYPPLYGAFFAFGEEVGEEFYFCECEREAIINYIQLRTKHPLNNYSGPKTNPLGADAFPPYVSEMSISWKNNLLDHIKFKEHICFRCNKKIPKKHTAFLCMETSLGNITVGMFNRNTSDWVLIGIKCKIQSFFGMNQLKNSPPKCRKFSKLSRK